MINALRILSILFAIASSTAVFSTDYWYTNPLDYFSLSKTYQTAEPDISDTATTNSLKTETIQQYPSVASEYEEILLRHDRLLKMYGGILYMHDMNLSEYENVLYRHAQAWRKYNEAISGNYHCEILACQKRVRFAL